MEKCFNTTGVCIPELNYMVNIEEKLNKITNMVNRGQYFVINRPRQYGKTTTMYMLEQRLVEDYMVINCSFEGLGEENFNNSLEFSKTVLKLFSKSIRFTNKEFSKKLLEASKVVNGMMDLSDAITDFIEECDKEVILLIDEVDKSSNNQLFLNFLGMLRNKYLAARQKKDCTFHSVILAGVHDVKNLKLRLRTDDEKKYNSPWNIAVDFDVDMSFKASEIESMILEYCNLNFIEMNTSSLAKKIYYYTNGYPFLVSRLCQIIDEKIKVDKKTSWTDNDIDRAVKEILKENNTLFDDLVKNLENNKELYSLVSDIVLNGTRISFNSLNPLINMGLIYGIFKNNSDRVYINNRIYEQFIYNYMTSKLEIDFYKLGNYNFRDNFIVGDNKLDFKKVLIRFQQFMKEQYSTIDSSFIEREGRLLFLAFIKPIINGIGFDFKEVQISEEKRLDIVVTYNNDKYIIELKIWHGNEYHQRGLKQLADYLDIHGLNVGYLVVYNFNKNKEYKQERVIYEGKEIFVVYV